MHDRFDVPVTLYIWERIRPMRNDQKARGGHLGGPVLSGLHRGELVPHEAEQGAIAEIVALRA
jgi:hypothetical protein